jgi:hypothetical protein
MVQSTNDRLCARFRYQSSFIIFRQIFTRSATIQSSLISSSKKQMIDTPFDANTNNDRSVSEVVGIYLQSKSDNHYLFIQ